MPLTHFPYGVSSFGIPLVGSDVGIPNQSGLVWFVDATYGSDGNDGFAPSSALKTIQAAVNKAGNGMGDTIFVFPGSYTENVTVSKDYLTIIGAMISGYAKPDVEAASGVTLTVTAQGFVARHIRFAGVADAIRQQGNGFIYEDCVFDGDGNGATTALFRLLPSSTNTHLTASEGRILSCLFRGSGGFGLLFDTGAAPVGVGSTDNLIAGNTFQANTGVDIATAKSGAGGAYSVQVTAIRGNYFVDKNKATYVDLTTNADGAAGSQSGSFDGNYIASDTMTTTKIKAVGTAFTFAGNIDTVGVFDGSGLD